jgi:integrase
MATAMHEGLIRHNPTTGAALPARDAQRAAETGEDDEPDRRALTRDQLAALLLVIPERHKTLVRLLASTGLRISEALALSCGDVDLDGGVITVRAGKRGLTRLVPLHVSALRPLRDFAAERQRRQGRPDQDDAFFRTDYSERISYNTAFHAFSVARRRLGWDADGRTRLPRVHDLRHRMVVRRIQTWHVEGVDVDAKMAALATYLGHIEVRDVYWYLSAVPELMNVVADRFEAFSGPPGAP